MNVMENVRIPAYVSKVKFLLENPNLACQSFTRIGNKKDFCKKREADDFCKT